MSSSYQVNTTAQPWTHSSAWKPLFLLEAGFK